MRRRGSYQTRRRGATKQDEERELPGKMRREPPWEGATDEK